MRLRIRPASAIFGAAVALVGGACLIAGSPRGAAELWWAALLSLIAGATLHALADPIRSDGALYGNVLARRLDARLSLWQARVLVVIATPLAGAGAVAYAATALFDALTDPEPAAPVDWRRSAGTGMIGLSAVLAIRAAGIVFLPSVAFWSILLVASGLPLFWGTAGARGQADLADFGEHGENRTLIGIVLVVAGSLLFITRTFHFHHAGPTAIATVVVITAIVLVVGPFLVRSRRRLETERIGRARAMERAELADELHDSVMQTLALIQRRTDDPAAVAMLARRQERDLRDWLLGRRAGLAAETLEEALRAVVADVEDTFGSRCDIVTVGNTALDARCDTLLAATREALVNASRHAPGSTVSVFMRVDPDRIQIFVHDRGPGFDPDRIPLDRHGITDSILGRMQRNGGSAEIRSAPGAGCEVTLTMMRR